MMLSVTRTRNKYRTLSKRGYAFLLICGIIFLRTIEMRELLQSNNKISQTENKHDSEVQPLKHESMEKKHPSLYVKPQHKVEMRMDLKTTRHKWPWGLDNYRTEQRCKDKQYNYAELPKASVIICFHETEELENLLHTLHSIIQNTPDELLQEIILVDDNSQRDTNDKFFLNYIHAVFGGAIKMIHNPGPELWGVIQARLRGIRAAAAPVVVVLDAHMEMRERWLEPLLLEIAKDRRTLASVTLDWMKPQNDGSWIYEHGPNDGIVAWFWQHFSFSLWVQESYNNTNRMITDPTQPVLNPCTIGTWAMDRSFFEEIGELDEGMKLWGGENIDLAIRTYLWDGRVVGVPCSHGAHLEDSLRGYRRDWAQQIVTNYKRIVEVWLDEYKETFFYYNPDTKQADAGDLTERLKVKERCPHTFKTYLDRGYPQMGHVFGDNFARGGLSCTAVADFGLSWQNPWTYGLRKYNHDVQRFEIYLTVEGHLRFDLAVFNGEKDTSGDMSFTSHTTFREIGPHTQWLHVKGGVMKASTFNGCMQAVKGSELIELAPCDDNNPYQQWQFETYTEQYLDVTKGIFQAKTDYHKELHNFVNSHRDSS